LRCRWVFGKSVCLCLSWDGSAAVTEIAALASLASALKSLPQQGLRCSPEDLPDMELGDFLFSENIGAYSAASSTYFNGFPPATVVHVNQ
jgi:hypothetical protein